MKPFTTKNSGEQLVPCGKCPKCLARRASGWSFRLMQEEKHSYSAHFVTYTYANENLIRTERNYRTLFPRHLELYWKQYRKSNPLHGIRYFACGEYGDKNMRPHYHAILFNGVEGEIIRHWPHGSVFIGTVTGASVGYCLKYMQKPKKIPQHRNDDRLPEFQRFSKGLGKSYLTEAIRKWHTADLENRMYCNTEDGKKIAMPRYFKNKIYTEEERSHVGAMTAMRLVEKRNEIIESYEQVGKDFHWEEQQAIEAEYHRMYNNALKGRHL